MGRSPLKASNVPDIVQNGPASSMKEVTTTRLDVIAGARVDEEGWGPPPFHVENILRMVGTVENGRCPCRVGGLSRKRGGSCPVLAASHQGRGLASTLSESDAAVSASRARPD
jgi:hypothetical protein